MLGPAMKNCPKGHVSVVYMLMQKSAWGGSGREMCYATDKFPYICANFD